MHMYTACTHTGEGLLCGMEGRHREIVRCKEFKREENSSSKRDLTRCKSQISNRSKNKTMRRVEEGEKRRRAAVFQDTMSIPVADFGCF